MPDLETMIQRECQEGVHGGHGQETLQRNEDKSITNSKTTMGIRKVHTWHLLVIARLRNINEISFLQCMHRL